MLTCINLSEPSKPRADRASITNRLRRGFVHSGIVRPIAWPLANDKASWGLAAIGPVSRMAQLTNPKPRYGRFIQKNV